MAYSEWLIEFDIVLNDNSKEQNWLKMEVKSVTNKFPTADDIQRFYQIDIPDMKEVIITNRIKLQ